MTALQPARVEIARDVLARITRRVADAEIGYARDDDVEWKYGADAAWLASLRDHWRDHYDWRSAEAAFNAHPQIAIPASGF